MVPRLDVLTLRCAPKRCYLCNRKGGCQRFYSLTYRERWVLWELSRGLLNKQIARELGISSQTLKNHLTSLYQKMDVARLGCPRTSAVMKLLRWGAVRTYVTWHEPEDT